MLVRECQMQCGCSLQADFAPLLRLRLAAGPGLVPGPSPQRLVRQLPQLWGDPCHLDMFYSTYHGYVLHVLSKTVTASKYQPRSLNRIPTTANPIDILTHGIVTTWTNTNPSSFLQGHGPE